MAKLKIPLELFNLTDDPNLPLPGENKISVFSKEDSLYYANKDGIYPVGSSSGSGTGGTSGETVVSFQINTLNTAAATADNIMAIGDRLSVVFSEVTGTYLFGTVKFTL
jgi:hypothetical protein